ncbi:hypothetical protein EV649_4337 [Kribbella sp. VKM Ac-2569]|uniref:DUF4440 domain-containing protein n=1 Tax=Kribbella sp. VKM Ac-2569 TaxID=2512220 RepID=UPI00102C70AF|nr:DUF4440 domain-containing protein [Kribbella sp. VKM Ac-2569]RZT16804.1 hypothetical protein EV649_4337 [Kribbella sp. VKM Ac-2569]
MSADLNRPEPDPDKAELDRLMGLFFSAFTNTDGPPHTEHVHEVFIPQGTIISQTGDQTIVYDLDSFIAPRHRILTDGTLTEFAEWEVSEQTEIYGSIAHRFSEYRKSGIQNGEQFEGGGHKTTQFVRTPAGWRISSIAWEDDNPTT